jgi:uncharacterized protein (DUF305 family)
MSQRRIVFAALATAIAVVALAIVAIVMSDSRVADEPALPKPPLTDRDAGYAYDASIKLQESVYLAELALMNTNSIEILTLARDMRAEQLGQIEQLRVWLEESQRPAAFDYDPQYGIGEVLTPVELETLANARDAEFDALFVEAVYQHHLVTISRLVALPAESEAPELVQLGKEIIATKQQQLKLLAELR